LKEGIVPPFLNDGRVSPVSRQHERFIRQSENLFANTPNQQRMVAPGKVRPADAPGEKDVASEEDIFGGGVKAEAPGTVAGDKKDGKGRTAKINVRCFIDQKVRLDRFSVEIEALVFEKIRICHQGETIFMVSNLAFGCPLELGGINEVVRVTVGQEQQIESDSQVPDPIRRPGRGIDQSISSWRLDQVGVGIENTANKSLKVEHSE
jgi:hypothetical protein